MSINEIVSFEDDYANLADDVLGENGDEDTSQKKEFDPFSFDESNSDDSDSEPNAFGQKAEDSTTGKTHSKTYQPYLAFDFRRMKKHRWPEGCELLLPSTTTTIYNHAKEELKKALVAEERFKSMSKRSGVSSSVSSHVGAWGDVQKSGPSTHSSYGSMDYMELIGGSDSEDDNAPASQKKVYTDADLASPAPVGATFETLGDGSTALIIQEGCRLKLDLSDLVDDAWKKRADIRVEDTGKKRMDSGNSSGSKYSSSAYMRKKKIKRTHQ